MQTVKKRRQEQNPEKQQKLGIFQQKTTTRTEALHDKTSLAEKTREPRFCCLLVFRLTPLSFALKPPHVVVLPLSAFVMKGSQTPSSIPPLGGDRRRRRRHR